MSVHQRLRVVVIVAHPDSNSFTSCVAGTAIAALEGNGHNVECINLYEQRFGAAMSAREREAYHSDTPILDPQVQHSADAVQSCDVLVFVYPTWWSSLPAIMKGWLERVMVPGVGFVLDEHHRLRPGLGNVRHIVGISTYGSPRRYVKLINDNGRRTIMRALRLSTGWRTRTKWLAMYSIDASTAAQRAAFLGRVQSSLATL